MICLRQFLILTKEREGMAKGKDSAKSKANNAQKIVQKVASFSSKIWTLLIRQVHYLEPSNNTSQRILSAAVLIPIAIYAIFYSKSVFILFSLAITVLMTFEWIDITKSAENQKKWRTLGFFYIVIPVYAIIKIRLHDANILLWMFAIIWSTDIFAFFAGRMLGGPKLAPTISPNKTWSGLAGGMVASMLIGFISAIMFNGGVLFFVCISVFFAALEQSSDLMESKIKRIFGVKDSGNIIPGHGGVLDRLDGMILLAPAILLLITLFPEKF